MTKQIIVLGMHRSGTSLVAGILSKLGVSMGNDVFGKTRTNPTGHFEDIDFVVLNDKILKAAGGDWDDPPEKTAIIAQEDQYAPKLKQLINSRKGTWGCKDPRTCLTIDLYLPFLNYPLYIVCRRDRNDIVNSLNKRDNMKFREAAFLISRYNFEIDYFLDNSDARYIEINYDDIIERPNYIIDSIIEFLKLNPTEWQKVDALDIVLPRQELNEAKRQLS